MRFRFLLAVSVALVALSACNRYSYTETKDARGTYPVRVDNLTGKTEMLKGGKWIVVGTATAPGPSAAPTPDTSPFKRASRCGNQFDYLGGEPTRELPSERIASLRASAKLNDPEGVSPKLTVSISNQTDWNVEALVVNVTGDPVVSKLYCGNPDVGASVAPGSMGTFTIRLEATNPIPRVGTNAGTNVGWSIVGVNGHPPGH